MKISNQELVNELKKLRTDECVILAKFIYFLAEAVKREIHLSEGYSSLFDFLVKKFGYSEGSAARRAAAVKVYRLCPEVLDLVRKNEVTLSNLHLIAKHVKEENAQELVKACMGKNKVEMESYLVRKFYQGTPAPKRDVVKPVPTTSSVETEQGSFAFEENFDEVQRPQNVRVSVTLDHETYEKLKRLQELSGKDQISDALDLALEYYLAKKDPEKNPPKLTKTSEERSSSRSVAPAKPRRRRHISKSLRREVHQRDGGQCCFRSKDGIRCTSRRHLQLDQIIPYSHGGIDSFENMRLMCPDHNRHRWRMKDMR